MKNLKKLSTGIQRFIYAINSPERRSADSQSKEPQNIVEATQQYNDLNKKAKGNEKDLAFQEKLQAAKGVLDKLIKIRLGNVARNYQNPTDLISKLHKGIIDMSSINIFIEGAKKTAGKEKSNPQQFTDSTKVLLGDKPTKEDKAYHLKNVKSKIEKAKTKLKTAKKDETKKQLEKEIKGYDDLKTYITDLPEGTENIELSEEEKQAELSEAKLNKFEKFKRRYDSYLPKVKTEEQSTALLEAMDENSENKDSNEYKKYRTSLVKKLKKQVQDEKKKVQKNMDTFGKTKTKAEIASEKKKAPHERVQSGELSQNSLVGGTDYSRPGRENQQKAKYFSTENQHAIVDEDLGAIKRLVTEEKLKGFLGKNPSISSKLTNGGVDLSKLNPTELQAYGEFYGKVLSESSINGNKVDGLFLPTEISQGLMEEQGRGISKTADDLAQRSNKFITALKKGGYKGGITMKHWPGYDSTKNSDEKLAYSNRSTEEIMKTVSAMGKIKGADSVMVSSIHYANFGSNIGMAKGGMTPLFADPKAIKILRKNNGDIRVMTDDLTGYKKSSGKSVEEVTEMALKAGVDQVMFKEKGDQALAQKAISKYMKTLQEKAKGGNKEAQKEYSERVKRMEKNKAPNTLTQGGEAFKKDIESRVKLQDAAKKIQEKIKKKPGTKPTKEELKILKAGEESEKGFGRSEVSPKDMKTIRPEWEKEEAAIKAWKEKEKIQDKELRDKLGKKFAESIKGKSNAEILDMMESNQEGSEAHFLKKDPDGTFTVDFGGVNEKLIGMGHFEKTLMSKFQYVKVYNPKTGQTVIGARGVRGGNKPGYFDINTGKYIPIFSGSKIKGLSAKDIKGMNIQVKNAMAKSKAMSIGDYMKQAKEKRTSYRNGIKDGSIKFDGASVGGGPIDGDVGSLSERYESGGKGPLAFGYDSTGGASYGTYQMSTRSGNAGKFARGIGISGRPGSSQFRASWRAKVKEMGVGAFKKAEHDYIGRTHYQPLLNRAARKLGISPSEIPKALKQVIWSTGVQHGPGSKVINRAIQVTGVTGQTLIKNKNAQKSLINNIYGIRRGKFPSSTARVRASVMRRFSHEKAIANRMVDAYASQPAAKTDVKK